jgi:hypothetical protein
MILLEKIRNYIHSGPMGNNLYRERTVQGPDYNPYFSQTQDYNPTGPEDTYQSSSFLDWLIPQQLRSDIQARGYSGEDKAQFEYEKLYDEMKEKGYDVFSSSGFHPIGYDQWLDKVEKAGFLDFTKTMGSGGNITHRLKPFNEVDPAEFNTVAANMGYKEAATMDPFSPESIAGGLTGVGLKYQAGQLDVDPAKMIQPLSIGGLRKMHTGAYSDYLGQRRDPLEKQLSSKLATAAGAGGDFAGYGRRQELGDVARGSFMEKVGDIYGDIDRQREAATQSTYDIMKTWEELPSYVG